MVFMLLLTGISVVGAVLCKYASCVQPEGGGFWPMLAMIVPFVILVNLLFALVWLACGKWRIALLPLLAIVLQWTYIGGIVRYSFSKSEAESADLRVATLNAFGFKWLGSTEASATAISGVMNLNQIDVLCLQECVTRGEQSLDSIARFFAPALPYFAVGGEQAVLSRYPIIACDSCIFADTINGYLLTDLLVNKDTVRVISAHLQTTGVSMLGPQLQLEDKQSAFGLLMANLCVNSSIRAQQTEQICGIADTTRLPLIVAGDFNDPPSSYTYHRLYKNLNDGFREVGSGLASTYSLIKGLLRIDYIFCNDRMKCMEYRTLPDALSDHNAVTAAFQINR